MVIVFGLATAILYGSADFLGGTASRRSRALSVAALSVPVGAVVLLAAALLSGTWAPAAGLGWAIAAGAVGAAGLIVFYAGLAAGPMSVVAPVSALVSTVLPVSVAVALGENLGSLVFAGAALCLIATVLISLDHGPPARPSAAATGPAFLRDRPALRGFTYGAAAGTMFGIFFVFLRNAGTSGALWPAATSRLANTAVVLAIALLVGARPVGRAAGARVLAAAAGSGVLDASANLCYILATRAGLFGIAAVLTSLYPGITVLLARVVLGERMQAVQRIGLVLAGAGIVLVTL